ncbi:FAD-dependent oxidoreductase [Actinacidiphila guanduensis]|uniref:Pyridine nucleotide-disulphide oxidoreductase n=1 Tax=Actinacidiphila guanduensis TaxID=310781 RepID=A0A1H0NBN6_9ACTN|nr:FAD-dependent oxidoreductase [Actinacidiphila guanduensis]SDO90071.1 Pyridine nucleotide-disulphide oxidoreductase [Actinacidiphila guanduensis]
MNAHIVVVGGGGSGILVANRLRCYCGSDGVRITVVDRYDTRDHEAELLTVLGLYGPDTLHAPEHRLLREGIAFLQAEAAAADLDRSEVALADGTTLPFDILVVATGRPHLPGPAGGSSFVTRTAGLADATGTVAVDPRTRACRTHPRVYAIGAGASDTSGAELHAQAERLARSVRGYLAADPPPAHPAAGHRETAGSDT